MFKNHKNLKLIILVLITLIAVLFMINMTLANNKTEISQLEQEKSVLMTQKNKYDTLMLENELELINNQITNVNNDIETIRLSLESQLDQLKSTTFDLPETDQPLNQDQLKEIVALWGDFNNMTYWIDTSINIFNGRINTILQMNKEPSFDLMGFLYEETLSRSIETLIGETPLIGMFVGIVNDGDDDDRMDFKQNLFSILLVSQLDPIIEKPTELTEESVFAYIDKIMMSTSLLQVAYDISDGRNYMDFDDVGFLKSYLENTSPYTNKISGTLTDLNLNDNLLGVATPYRYTEHRYFETVKMILQFKNIDTLDNVTEGRLQ